MTLMPHLYGTHDVGIPVDKAHELLQAPQTTFAHTEKTPTIANVKSS